MADRFLLADGELLKRFRREKALSQRDLARETGISPDTIGQLERGHRQARPSTIRKLAQVLGTEPKELLK